MKLKLPKINKAKLGHIADWTAWWMMLGLVVLTAWWHYKYHVAFNVVVLFIMTLTLIKKAENTAIQEFLEEMNKHAIKAMQALEQHLKAGIGKQQAKQEKKGDLVN